MKETIPSKTPDWLDKLREFAGQPLRALDPLNPAFPQYIGYTSALLPQTSMVVPARLRRRRAAAGPNLRCTAKLRKAHLRDCARKALEQRGYSVEDVGGAGVVPGARLRISKGSKAYSVAVRTSLERKV